MAHLPILSLSEGELVSAWPEKYPIGEILQMYNDDISPGRIDFVRNLMCDMSAEEYQPELIWTEAPCECFEWIMSVDLGSLSAPKEAPASYTAMVIIGHCPQGWGIVNGAAGRWNVEEFLSYFNALQLEYRPKLVIIENTGSAPMLAHSLQRRGMACVLIDAHSPSDKRTRWIEALLPALASRRLVLSTDNRPFLKTVRDVFKRWPDYKLRGDIGSDILDALTNAVPYLKPLEPPKPKPKVPNPYFAFRSV